MPFSVAIHKLLPGITIKSEIKLLQMLLESPGIFWNLSNLTIESLALLVSISIKPSPLVPKR